MAQVVNRFRSSSAACSHGIDICDHISEVAFRHNASGRADPFTAIRQSGNHGGVFILGSKIIINLCIHRLSGDHKVKSILVWSIGLKCRKASSVHAIVQLRGIGSRTNCMVGLDDQHGFPVIGEVSWRQWLMYEFHLHIQAEAGHSCYSWLGHLLEIRDITILYNVTGSMVSIIKVVPVFNSKDGLVSIIPERWMVAGSCVDIIIGQVKVIQV